MNKMNKVISTNPKEIRNVMELVGSRIGSVHFRKRKDGSLRKMSYRLHVKNPTVANPPKGTQHGGVDVLNAQMTVFDCNKVIHSKDGNIVGRGAWRTVPLETVERVVANGVTYLVKGRSC